MTGVNKIRKKFLEICLLEVVPLIGHLKPIKSLQHEDSKLIHKPNMKGQKSRIVSNSTFILTKVFGC